MASSKKQLQYLERETWTIGSKVRIYSNSASKWMNGTIKKIYNDAEGEWLRIAYPGFIKEVQRYNEDIKPVRKERHEEKKITIDETSKIIASQSDKLIIEKLPMELQELYIHRAEYKLNDDGSLTFYPTPNCKPSERKLITRKMSLNHVLQEQNCKSAACYSNPECKIEQTGCYSTICSFITGAAKAWSEHYPFKFRVDHIWILILQAVAIHVDKNAEKLRPKYVKHEGKKQLKVRVSGIPTAEEWIQVIKEFGGQIDANTVEDTCELLECDFSTSTLTEKIAAKVSIMDICKNYFEYSVVSDCGFPRITLDGTKNDWIKLKAKAVKLLNEKVDKKFGHQWGQALLPLLDRFIAAFNGKIDCLFWNSMIKRGARNGSGGYTWFSGWFNILFPFISKVNEPNKYCVPYSMKLDYVCTNKGNDTKGTEDIKFPIGISSAPVKWQRFGQKIDMKFLSGFVGYTVSESLEICPNIAWCIAYCNTEIINSKC